MSHLYTTSVSRLAPLLRRKTQEDVVQALSAARYDAGTLSDSTNAGTLARISTNALECSTHACSALQLDTIALVTKIVSRDVASAGLSLALPLCLDAPSCLGNIALPI